MIKTDQEIGAAVVDELEWDVKINERAIQVEVDGGTVVLLGTVESWAERLAANEAAYRVAGVRDVRNRIEVTLKPEARVADTELARLVQCVLAGDVFIAKTKIASSVSDGQVILEGRVDCHCQREDAERVVRNIRGVRRVLNQILVKPELGEAHRVQTALEAALERRVEGGARLINLDVHDGKVILSGIVHSWAERQSVLAAARGTRGVRSVDDRLSFEP